MDEAFLIEAALLSDQGPGGKEGGLSRVMPI
jgi:hypothetical protein